MKKVYEAPAVHLEQFVANEYIAACGDTEYGKYLFECNAGDLGLKKYPYEVYVDYRGNGRYTYRANYHACGAKHEADKTDDFYNGYMDDTRTPGNDNIKVIVWTDHGRDTHCTTELDRESWQTTKS